jgi:hypothetical protein
MTGETLKIYASGNQFEISGMMHGQADALVRAFHAPNKLQRIKPRLHRCSWDTDPFVQLGRLGRLRDKGLFSDAEFEARKSEIVGTL